MQPLFSLLPGKFNKLFSSYYVYTLLYYQATCTTHSQAGSKQGKEGNRGKQGKRDGGGGGQRGWGRVRKEVGRGGREWDGVGKRLEGRGEGKRRGWVWIRMYLAMY